MLEDDDRLRAVLGESPEPDPVSIDLLQYVDDSHILKRMAIEVARAFWLPPSTVFMVGMGIVSSVAMRKYAVCYEDGTMLPLGLYGVAEQSSGAAKSPCVRKFKEPFLRMSADIKRKYKPIMVNLEAKLNNVDKGSLEQLEAVKKTMAKQVFISNTTGEGLEKTLSISDGYFSCLGEEKGLLNSLLGNTYGGNGRANNNDIAQNGYAGEMYVGGRSSRDSYAGIVVGSIIVFAQSGSFKTLFEKSETSGLFERFFVLSEPSLVGKRNFNNFGRMDNAVVHEYENKCSHFYDAIEKNVLFDDLICKKLSKKSWTKINDMMNRLEPERCGNGKYSTPTASSMANKLNMLAIKIAAILYLFSHSDRYIDDYIPEKYIDAGLSISMDLFDYTIRLLDAMCIVGREAEYSAVYPMFEKNGNKWRSYRQIHNNLRTTKEFAHIREGAAARSKELIEEMVRKGLLEMFVDGGKVMYRMA